MKKQFAAISMVVLLLSSFMACNIDDSDNQPDNQETVRGIYGKIEIPDISCSSLETANEALKQCLDQMVFESYVFGDYKVSLVGDNVRTDKANFAGVIYTQNLRVEVEKNGKKLGGEGYYNDIVLGVAETMEYKLLENRIGSYIDVYELDNPVIAMRYFYDNDMTNETVAQAVEFGTIMNDEIYVGFVGLCKKGTGIEFGESDRPIVLNEEDNVRCRVSVFTAEEFKIIDNMTLADEEAGIRYVFKFNNPPQMDLYIAEKLSD